ncbi:MAG: chitobiase/beta-hexosaminidase C-terminal domain-containing protein [Bacteroidota bacterium]
MTAFRAMRYLFLLSLLLVVSASAQVTVFSVGFDGETIGGAPTAVRGLGGERPTLVGGRATERMEVVPVFGDPGGSGASGLVARIDVPATGDFHVLDFDHSLSGGLVTSGTVQISFDIAVEESVPSDGFAFLRAYDEAEEDVGSVILSFDGASLSIGLLDYDPETGDFRGVVYPEGSSSPAGTWRRVGLTYDLDASTLRLAIDGADTGIETGLNRATGTGLLGAFFNWGGAYVGRCAIDNVSVTLPEDEGLPAPPAAFLDLLEPETHGGTILRPRDGDFRQRGVAFENSGTIPLRWSPVYDGVATYRAVLIGDGLDEADARPAFVRTVPVQRNRTYEVSALIRTDFPRDDWEFNVIAFGVDPDLTNLEGGRYGGMPAVTGGPEGWERWTWRFTPHWPTATEIRFALGFHEYGLGFNDDVSIEIADFAVVELPEVPLSPFAPGEGVTFPGGPGALDMRIEDVREQDGVLSVEIVGVTFDLDRTAGTLTLRQRAPLARDLAVVSGLDLSGLGVVTEADDVAVLVGSAITVGVQADGAVVLSPHGEMTATVESRIGGDFNRIAVGDLFSMDDWGGFTANVHVPLGTGRVPRLAGVGGLPFQSIAPDDLDTPGAASPGWRARAQISPGERLFVSAFPSRGYEWEESFEFAWRLAGFGESAGDIIESGFTSDWLLWNIHERAWAMSFGPRYELRDDVPFQGYLNAVAAADGRWLAYFSQWFYLSRDPQVFADEVRRWRDTYGMQGMYSDGLAQDDWLSAYIAARLLRGEVYPDGTVILHDSFPQSGVAAAAFRPFIYSYATATYMAENAPVSAGAEWSWARYVTGQYGRSNAFGVTKGDGWTGFEGIEKYLVALVWGGRGNPDVVGFNEVYLPILQELEALWETYGDEPNFFERVYHPEAQRLTGYAIGRAGMPTVMRETVAEGEEITLDTWTEGAEIRYTVDGSIPTAASALYSGSFVVAAGTRVTARAFRADLSPSLWATEGGGMPVRAETPSAPGALALRLVGANPVRRRATFALTMPEAGTFRLEVFDGLGRRVGVLAKGERMAGPHTASLDVRGLAPGVYTARLIAGDQVRAVRFTIAR